MLAREAFLTIATRVFFNLLCEQIRYRILSFLFVSFPDPEWSMSFGSSFVYTRFSSSSPKGAAVEDALALAVLVTKSCVSPPFWTMTQRMSISISFRYLEPVVTNNYVNRLP